MVVTEILEVGKEQDNIQAVTLDFYRKAQSMLPCGELPHTPNHTSTSESESSAYPDIFFPLLSWSSPKVS